MSRANAKTKDLDSFFPADSSPLALDLLRRMVSAYREQYTEVSRPLSYSGSLFPCAVPPSLARGKCCSKHCSKNTTGRYLLLCTCCTPKQFAPVHRSNNAINLFNIHHDSYPSFSVPVGVSPGTPYHRRRGIGARVSCRPSWAGKSACHDHAVYVRSCVPKISNYTYVMCTGLGPMGHLPLRLYFQNSPRTAIPNKKFVIDQFTTWNEILTKGTQYKTCVPPPAIQALKMRSCMIHGLETRYRVCYALSCLACLAYSCRAYAERHCNTRNACYQ